MIESYNKVGSNEHVVVFWQEPKDPDTPIGEPAITMKAYSDVLHIQQGKHYINVTLECAPELLKAIKLVMKSE